MSSSLSSMYLLTSLWERTLKLTFGCRQEKDAIEEVTSVTIASNSHLRSINWPRADIGKLADKSGRKDPAHTAFLVAIDKRIAGHDISALKIQAERKLLQSGAG